MNIINNVIGSLLNLRSSNRATEDSILGRGVPVEDGPYDGWGFYVLNAACAAQKLPNAFSQTTADGYTIYEAALAEQIQQRFKDKHQMDVSLERIHAMEQEASTHNDYYNCLASACWYEAVTK